MKLIIIVILCWSAVHILITIFIKYLYDISHNIFRSVATEIKQNVRRIQSHPSIALWAGNNENEVALRSNW